MGRFGYGFVMGWLLLAGALFLAAMGGFLPVAATDAPLPLEKEFAGMAVGSAAARRAPKTIPIQPTEANLAAGARLYRDHCALCHGLPGRSDSPVAAGLSPPPPRLLEKGGMVTDDPPTVTFWKASNGIRLTGMPAFQASLSSDELWQVSLFLANADRLPPSAKQALAPPQPADNPAAERPRRKPQ